MLRRSNTILSVAPQAAALQSTALCGILSQSYSIHAKLANYKTAKPDFGKVVRTVPAKHKNFYGNTKPTLNETYTLQLLESYKENRDWQMAVALFNKIVEKNVILSVYAYRSFLYTVAYRGRNLDEGKRIFEHFKMKHPNGDIHCYNTMIHACHVNRDHVTARQWFDELKTKAKPNSFSYNYLLKSLVNPENKQTDESKKTPVDEKDKEKALQIVEMIKQDNAVFLANPHIQKTLSWLQVSAQ